MKTVTWTVRLKTAPTAVRYCKRCGVRAAFASSGLFRVNAQQKCLDVWLIYKCCVCDTTWNLTVFSRIAPRSIPAELLSGFYDNDPGLAMRYAADTALVKQNGADPEPPDVEVIGPEVTLDEPARIRIVPEWPITLKADTVLRKKLGLSRGELDALLKSGTLTCSQILKKSKLLSEITVELR